MESRGDGRGSDFLTIQGRSRCPVELVLVWEGVLETLRGSGWNYRIDRIGNCWFRVVE